MYWSQEAFAEQQSRVKALFERWIKRIGLGWWTITIDYGEKLDPLRDVDDDTDGWQTTMICSPKWQYMQANIAIDLRQAVTMSDDALENAVVHELLHVFLCELREPDNDGKHEERVASTLANAFIWFRDAALAGELEEQAREVEEG